MPTVNSCTAGSQQLHGWQSTAALLAVNSCTAGSQQQHCWQSTAALLVDNSCTAGSQQLHCWQSTAALLTVNSFIANSVAVPCCLWFGYFFRRHANVHAKFIVLTHCTTLLSMLLVSPGRESRENTMESTAQMEDCP